jgi:hypothetical protein
VKSELERIWKEAVVARYLSEGLEEIHEKPESVQLVSSPKFKSRTSKKCYCSSSCSMLDIVATFGVIPMLFSVIVLACALFNLRY